MHLIQCNKSPKYSGKTLSLLPDCTKPQNSLKLDIMTLTHLAMCNTHCNDGQGMLSGHKRFFLDALHIKSSLWIFPQLQIGS